MRDPKRGWDKTKKKNYKIEQKQKEQTLGIHKLLYNKGVASDAIEG